MITGQSIKESDVVFRFTPITEFEANGNVYVPQMRYSVRHEDEGLAELVYEWFKTGKIEIVEE